MKNILKEAINKWGIDFQFTKLAEEAAELCVAAMHCLRARSPTKIDALAEEIADVMILIEVTFMIDPKIPKMVEDWKRYKLSRLKERLEDGELKRSAKRKE